MKYLYEKIAGHWQSLVHKDDIEKLKEYSEAGRALTLGYLSNISFKLIDNSPIRNKRIHFSKLSN